jgi:hypothetical protein
MYRDAWQDILCRDFDRGPSSRYMGHDSGISRALGAAGLAGQYCLSRAWYGESIRHIAKFVILFTRLRYRETKGNKGGTVCNPGLLLTAMHFCRR